MSLLHRFWTWLTGTPPRDARGGRVSVPFLGGYPAALWSRVHKLSPDAIRRVRERCEAHHNAFLGPNIVFTLLVAVPWMGLAFYMFDLVPGTSRFSSMAGIASALVPHLLALAVLTWHTSRLTSSVRLAALLKDNICPSCHYALRGAPVAADGCTICPECGAAWKVPERQAAPVS